MTTLEVLLATTAATVVFAVVLYAIHVWVNVRPTVTRFDRKPPAPPANGDAADAR